jgi:hypothetical protein
MNLSTRFLRLFALLPVAVFAVSCAQPETSPTSPTSVSAAASAVAAGPSAAYDATGTWRFVSTLDGEDPDTLVTEVTQLANGDLQFLDEDDSVVRLVRLSQGSGAVITYRLANTGSEGGACDIRSQGTVLLDTRTNTVTAHIRLKELGCEHQTAGVLVTGTKIS